MEISPRVTHYPNKACFYRKTKKKEGFWYLQIKLLHNIDRLHKRLSRATFEFHVKVFLIFQLDWKSVIVKSFDHLVTLLNTHIMRRRCNKQAITSKIRRFHKAKNVEKIVQWSPLWIIFKEKMKITHLLPERSVIGPEEMPILVLGRRKRPQLKWDRPKTYKFWQSPHFQNCDFELRIFF